MQGTCKFLILETGRLIKGRKFEALAMPEHFIKQVNAMGKYKGNEVQFRDRYEKKWKISGMHISYRKTWRSMKMMIMMIISLYMKN